MAYMKNIVALVFLLMVNLGLAQNFTNGQAIYSVQMVVPDSVKTMKGYDKSMVEGMSYGMSQLELALNFDMTKSSFVCAEKVQNEGSDLSLFIMPAKITIDVTNPYFYRVNDSTVNKETSALGELSYVGLSVKNLQWVLTKESKVINGYPCFKATATYSFISHKGNATKNIVAWYAPGIAVHYGPKNYVGLPGLIVELAEGPFLYQMKSITFNIPDLKILEKSPEATIFTQKEFNEKLANSSSYQEMSKHLKK